MLLADHYRRQAHNKAWYDSPSDEPNNLPIHLRNPFAKRNPRVSSRSNNDLHLQETGETNGKTLRQIKTDTQDYRPTTPQERAQELGLGDPKPHSATTPNVDSALDMLNENVHIPRSGSPVHEDNTKDKVEQVQEYRSQDSTSAQAAVENEVANKSPLDQDHEGAHQRKKGVLGRLFQKTSTETSNDKDDSDDKKKPRKVYTPMSQVKATILNSPINILLIACEYSSSIKSILTNFSSRRYRTLLRSR